MLKLLGFIVLFFKYMLSVIKITGTRHRVIEKGYHRRQRKSRSDKISGPEMLKLLHPVKQGDESDL